MNDQDESRNVEDVRGSSGGGFRPVHGVGLGTVVVALIAGWAFGINPLQILGVLSGGGVQQSQSVPASPSAPIDDNDPQVKFVSQVLRSTEVVWTDVFRSMGSTYQDPKLRLYRDSYPTACGRIGLSISTWVSSTS
jgi:predicted metalloprotease